VKRSRSVRGGELPDRAGGGHRWRQHDPRAARDRPLRAGPAMKVHVFQPAAANLRSHRRPGTGGLSAWLDASTCQKHAGERAERAAASVAEHAVSEGGARQSSMVACPDRSKEIGRCDEHSNEEACVTAAGEVGSSAEARWKLSSSLVGSSAEAAWEAQRNEGDASGDRMARCSGGSSEMDAAEASLSAVAQRHTRARGRPLANHLPRPA
jgi:hypothetical protein